MLSSVARSLSATSSSRPPRCGCSSWASATDPLAATAPATATTSDVGRTPNSLRTTHLLLRLPCESTRGPYAVAMERRAGRDRRTGRSGRAPSTRAGPPQRAAAVMRERAGRAPGVGLICGTGFAPCTDVARRPRHASPSRTWASGQAPSPATSTRSTSASCPGVTVAAVKAKVLPCDGATWPESGLPARSLALAGCRTPAVLGQLGLHARRRAARRLPGLHRPHQLLGHQPAGRRSARATAGRRPTCRWPSSTTPS